MDAENFFARWSRHKPESAIDTPVETKPPAEIRPPEQDLPPPTIEEVAALTPQSDYTRFVARGVDENIRRSAFKKLFADPHFNVMDGLDTYIEDYNKFEPIPPEMLALLNHAKGLLDPRAQFEHPLMRLLESAKVPEQSASETAPDEPAAAEENAAVQTHTPPSSFENDAAPSVPEQAGPPPQTMTKPDDDNTI